MSKLFTRFGMAALIAAAALPAMADEPSIYLFPEQYRIGGFMPECISANGKYVCGSSYSYAGFISEWQENKLTVYTEKEGSVFADYGCDLPFITNDGVAVGFDDNGSLRIDFPGETLTHPKVNGLVDCITEDGKIMVGMVYNKKESDYITPHNIDYQACYWKNDKAYLLPIPSEEDLGYYIQGSRARYISGDGKVIMGELIDRLYTKPMVLWYLQDDGTYQLDPVCMKYFSDMKYNEGYYREYVTFHANGMSNDGNWVSMTLRESPAYGSNDYSEFQTGLYNVQTGEIKKAVYKEENKIPQYTKFDVYVNGVSNNGTVVGNYENEFGGVSAFMMYSDEMEPKRLVDLFDSIGELADFEDNFTNMLSGISADGRYLCGMGWDINNQYNMGYYAGYVLDTGTDDMEHSGVETIRPSVESKIEYYTISGNKVNNPGKGIYIRVKDGKAEKVVL